MTHLQLKLSNLCTLPDLRKQHKFSFIQMLVVSVTSWRNFGPPNTSITKNSFCMYSLKIGLAIKKSLYPKPFHDQSTAISYHWYWNVTHESILLMVPVLVFKRTFLVEMFVKIFKSQSRSKSSANYVCTNRRDETSHCQKCSIGNQYMIIGLSFQLFPT